MHRYNANQSMNMNCLHKEPRRVGVMSVIGLTENIRRLKYEKTELRIIINYGRNYCIIVDQGMCMVL